MMFAIYVVGISNGVRVWNLERYILPNVKDSVLPVLNTNRLLFEMYSTVIGALQGIAWLLLVFFIFTLIAFVFLRVFEFSKSRRDTTL